MYNTPIAHSTCSMYWYSMCMVQHVHGVARTSAGILTLHTVMKKNAVLQKSTDRLVAATLCRSHHETGQTKKLGKQHCVVGWQGLVVMLACNERGASTRP